MLVVVLFPVIPLLKSLFRFNSHTDRVSSVGKALVEVLNQGQLSKYC